jgi:hypothetical protein
MKLYGWQNVNSAQEYREMIQAEYERLKAERSRQGETYGLEEVKLRLFLSLLEKSPVENSEDHNHLPGSDAADFSSVA